jgi:hypothetical protein
MEDANRSDFWVQCYQCNQFLKNHTGATPCCGSIGHVVGNDNVPARILEMHELVEAFQKVVIDFKDKHEIHGKLQIDIRASNMILGDNSWKITIVKRDLENKH